MAEFLVRRWGDDFAILVPLDVARDAGMSAGERWHGSLHRGDLLLRRPPLDNPADARRAAEDIIAESQHYTLETSIRTLLDEGRRG